jgi:small ubiquitin-related modifier
MNAYSDQQSIELNTIVFLYDGRQFKAEQTPDELEMEDEDEIDAMLLQLGGAPVNLGCSSGSCEKISIHDN